LIFQRKKKEVRITQRKIQTIHDRVTFRYKIASFARDRVQVRGTTTRRTERERQIVYFCGVDMATKLLVAYTTRANPNAEAAIKAY